VIATVLALFAAGNIGSAGNGRPADLAAADGSQDAAGASDSATGAPDTTPPLTGGGSSRATPSTAPGAAALARVEVRATGAPTWQDVLGAWHGQALVAVRNAGSKPVQVDARASRFAVLARDGSTLADGEFQAAVPPVLQSGATGYLVGGFTLVRAPGDGLKVLATPAAGPPDADAAPVALRVSGVDTAFRADTVTATGSVTNPRDTTVRDGVVAVILLDRAGRPLAGMLDVASAGRLAQGERTAFRADQPPVPPVDRASVQRSVAAAWGIPTP
jgi:hypothetical protein